MFDEMSQCVFDMFFGIPLLHSKCLMKCLGDTMIFIMNNKKATRREGMMDKRSISTEVPSTEEEMDVDKLLESLETRKNGSVCIPTCISSIISATKLRAEGIGTICGRLYIGTAENIPPSELIDTTGAGDAFTGDCSLRYLCQLFNRENAMLCCQCGSCQVQSSRGTKWSSAP